MDYIDRMIAVRVDADDTQRSLAKALGIHHVQWANYERRVNEMPLRYFLRFCQHYGISSDYLLGLDPNSDWPRK